MNRFIKTALFLLLHYSSYGQQEILIAFVTDGSPLDARFIDNHWPGITKLANTYGIIPKLITANDGLPTEIKVTPQIVFQNKNGRSLYVGRYGEIERLSVFIRSAKNAPRRLASHDKTNVLARKNGRSLTILPLKITSLTGYLTQDSDPVAFHQQAEEAFYEGFSQFSLDNVSFTSGDRAYYIDLHPYLSENGKLHVSYEIFSQFNCIEPVNSAHSEPVVADYNDRRKLFKQLGAEIEQWILHYSISANNGDGFTPVNATVTTWKKLGLEPIVENNNKPTVPWKEVSAHWKNPKPLDQFTPLVQFNFFPPLDSYAGEAKALSGELHWDNSLLSGYFEIRTGSITMGEASYDREVQKKYIKAKRFPKAGISFDRQLVDRALILTEPERVFKISGDLNFMGKEQAVDIQARFHPIISSDEQEHLIITARFNTNIYQTFGVKGPDGPKQAQEYMTFITQFILESNEK